MLKLSFLQLHTPFLRLLVNPIERMLEFYCCIPGVDASRRIHVSSAKVAILMSLHLGMFSRRAKNRYSFNLRNSSFKTVKYKSQSNNARARESEEYIEHFEEQNIGQMQSKQQR